MHGNADEEVVRDTAAVGEPHGVLVAVDFDDLLVRDVLDAALAQEVEDRPGELLRDRDRSRHRADGTNLDGIPDATFEEVIVKQHGSLERRRWALERVTEDPDQNRPRIEVQECLAHGLRARDGVVLDAALCESGCGGEVVVCSERNDEHVCVVRTVVGRYPSRLRVDLRHTFLAELDSVLGDIAVVQ